MPVNPYRLTDNYSITVWPTVDGRYRLSGPTYRDRAKIKAAGGQWDGKEWTLSRDGVRELHPSNIAVKCRIAAHCHMEDEECYIHHRDAIEGVTIKGCPRCDKSARCGDRVAVLEILDTDTYQLGMELAHERCRDEGKEDSPRDT